MDNILLKTTIPPFHYFLPRETFFLFHWGHVASQRGWLQKTPYFQRDRNSETFYRHRQARLQHKNGFTAQFNFWIEIEPNTF